MILESNKYTTSPAETSDVYVVPIAGDATNSTYLLKSKPTQSPVNRGTMYRATFRATY